MTNESENTADGTGWTCGQCGMWVPSGEAHFCAYPWSELRSENIEIPKIEYVRSEPWLAIVRIDVDDPSIKRIEGLLEDILRILSREFGPPR